jgi:hypothetical protein
MPELGTSGSVGTAGEQSPAVTRPYVYLLLEFQSRVDRLMAVRLLTCRRCEPC